MKLRNKQTGEIIELLAKPSFVKRNDDFLQSEVNTFNSLAELNEEWEDYEEPKKYWYITGEGDICRDDIKYSEWIEERKQIGNYFETKEEAEKAVEKLKAWKRLKDKGFRFNGVTPMEYFIRFTYDKPQQILDNQQHPETAQQFNKDLDLLFSQEGEK